jgi:hypothetical protein
MNQEESINTSDIKQNNNKQNIKQNKHKSKPPIKVQIGRDDKYFYQEYEIKKKSGKLRKIIAPSLDLKRYSRAAMHKLNWYFKNEAVKFGVYDNFHGFVPNRNSVTAAQYHIGFETTIMFDITNFFDNVKKHMFDEYLFESLELDEDMLFHTKGYAAQGFPSSPTLANIAIIRMFREIKEYLTSEFGRESEGFAATIYADDIQISFNDTDKSTWQRVRDNITRIASIHEFQINQQKTRVRFAKYGFRRILGVNVGDESIRATRKTMKKIKVIKHKVAIKEPRESGHYGQVLGGLTTWSKCKLPTKY